MVKILKILRNNWKKSLFGTGIIVYGINYGINLHYIEAIMRAYCEEAVKYGDIPTKLSEKHKRITVILNPAANKRKAKQNFEKYCAPLLYLSGMYVSVIETEKEGHAKQIIDKVDPYSDAIVIAGGDGTISETVTGLMRSQGELCRIPIGVLPLGKTNTLANSIFAPRKNLSHETQQMAEATMAIIKGNTKSIDAVRVEALDTEAKDKKPIYGLAGIEWGMWQSIKKQQEKLWYFGPLRRYASLVFPGEALEKKINAKVKYTPPCAGCSQCYMERPDLNNTVPSTLGGTRWWSKFTRKRVYDKNKGSVLSQEAPVIDYKSIINESCGSIEEKEIDTVDMCLTTANIRQSLTCDKPHLLLSIGPRHRYQGQFLSDGLKYIKGEEATTLLKIEVKQVEIRPYENLSVDSNPSQVEHKEEQLSIDSEDYEVRPIRVTILPKSVSVFCP